MAAPAATEELVVLLIRLADLRAFRIQMQTSATRPKEPDTRAVILRRPRADTLEAIILLLAIRANPAIHHLPAVAIQAETPGILLVVMDLLTIHRSHPEATALVQPATRLSQPPAVTAAHQVTEEDMAALLELIHRHLQPNFRLTSQLLCRLINHNHRSRAETATCIQLFPAVVVVATEPALHQLMAAVQVATAHHLTQQIQQFHHTEDHTEAHMVALLLPITDRLFQIFLIKL